MEMRVVHIVGNSWLTADFASGFWLFVPVDHSILQSTSQPSQLPSSQLCQASPPSQLTKSIKQAHVVFPVALVRKQTWNKMQFIIFEEEGLV